MTLDHLQNWKHYQNLRMLQVYRLQGFVIQYSCRGWVVRSEGQRRGGFFLPGLPPKELRGGFKRNFLDLAIRMVALMVLASEQPKTK